MEQPITAFSSLDAPISATLVFDSSRSMKPRIAMRAPRSTSS